MLSMGALLRHGFVVICLAATACAPSSAPVRPRQAPVIPPSLKHNNFAPPDLGLPYSYAEVDEVPGGYRIRGLRVRQPQGFEGGQALMISEIDVLFAAEQPEAPDVIRIEAIVLRNPRLVFDWATIGSNLDVLLHAVHTRWRAAPYPGPVPRWRLEMLIIEDGSLNVEDAWLGRERIDIPMPERRYMLLDEEDAGWSTAGLIERSGRALVEAVDATLEEFDQEMRSLDEAVDLQLQRYFGR